MKNAISAIAAVGILSIAITGVANAANNKVGGDQGLVVQPQTAGPVTNSLSNVKKTSASQMIATATGSWLGGTGSYVSTLTWGDGGTVNYQGTATTQTWTYLYGTQNTYRVKLATSSGGTTAYDWVDLYMPYSGY